MGLRDLFFGIREAGLKFLTVLVRARSSAMGGGGGKKK